MRKRTVRKSGKGEDECRREEEMERVWGGEEGKDESRKSGGRIDTKSRRIKCQKPINCLSAIKPVEREREKEREGDLKICCR